jgi:sugar phosphate permease
MPASFDAGTDMTNYDYRRFQRVRWSIYLILVVSYISVFFHRMAPGVVAADLMSTFHTSAAALGSLAAMYYYIYTLMQLPAGVLADTLGNRRSVTIGNLVAGLGSILFGLAQSFEMASLGRFLVGLGVSVIFVGLMKSNTVWFRERIYGIVSGMTLLIGNLGSVLAAGPLAALLNWWSWRTVFVAIGGFSLLLALFTLLFVRNRPQDAGFPSVREMGGEVDHAAREQHWWHDLMDVLKNLSVWPGFWINFGMAGGLFAFAGLWGIPLLQEVFGLDRGEAATYTTLTLFSMAVSTLLSGWVSDHLGWRKPVVLFSAVVYALAWLLLILVPWQPSPLAMLLFAVIGFTGGGFVLTYACAKEVCKPALSGMAISVVNTGLFLGAAIMQPLFGWVLDLNWDGTLRDGVSIHSWGNFQQAMWLMFGFALVALLGTWRLHETRCQNLSVANN